MDEVEMNLNIVDIFLQKQDKEDQKSGWIFVRKFKWLFRKLNKSKLRHRLSAWLKIVEEDLSESKYGQRSIIKEVEVHICEPKQGPILGEDENVEEEGRLDECLTKWLCCAHNNLPFILTIYWENYKAPPSKFLHPTTYGGFKHVRMTNYS